MPEMCVYVRVRAFTGISMNSHSHIAKRDRAKHVNDYILGQKLAETRSLLIKKTSDCVLGVPCRLYIPATAMNAYWFEPVQRWPPPPSPFPTAGSALCALFVVWRLSFVRWRDTPNRERNSPSARLPCDCGVHAALHRRPRSIVPL